MGHLLVSLSLLTLLRFSLWMKRSLSAKKMDPIEENLVSSVKKEVLAFEDSLERLFSLAISDLSDSLEPYLSLILHGHKRKGKGSAFGLTFCCSVIFSCVPTAREHENSTEDEDVVEKIFRSCHDLIFECRKCLDFFAKLSNGKTLYEVSEVISEAFYGYIQHLNSKKNRYTGHDHLVLGVIASTGLDHGKKHQRSDFVKAISCLCYTVNTSNYILSSLQQVKCDIH